MKLKVLFLILLLSVSACDFFDIPEPDAAMQQQVVFSAQSAEDQNLAIYVGTIESYWTPQESHITAMTRAVIEYLQTASEADILDRYDEYQQQYFGYVADGRELIYGNYFCDNFGMDWRNNFVDVLDGGDCYFQAVYDVSANEITRLSINGEA